MKASTPLFIPCEDEHQGYHQGARALEIYGEFAVLNFP